MRTLGKYIVGSGATFRCALTANAAHMVANEELTAFSWVSEASFEPILLKHPNCFYEHTSRRSSIQEDAQEEASLHSSCNNTHEDTRKILYTSAPSSGKSSLPSLLISLYRVFLILRRHPVSKRISNGDSTLVGRGTSLRLDNVDTGHGLSPEPQLLDKFVGHPIDKCQ